MIGRLTNKSASSILFTLELPPPPPFNGDKKSFFGKKRWRLDKKAKSLIAVAAIAIVLISCFAFLYKPAESAKAKTDLPTDSPSNTPTASPTHRPTSTPTINPTSTPTGPTVTITPLNPPVKVKSSNPPGLIELSPVINSTVWMQVAKYAWADFQLGVGVDNKTLLPYSGGQTFKAFTDWDLGAYIQAIIDAQQLGLENSTDANTRFNAILTFLQNRPINETTGYPFWFYDATNGTDYHPSSDKATFTADIADLGALFVALNNLRNFNSSYAPQINEIVLGNSNFTALLPDIQNSAGSNSTYTYFFDCGFASFWPQQVGYVPSEILSNILDSKNVTTFGVSLPEAIIGNEPLIRSVFELNNTDSNKLMALMTQVYLADEAYYNATYTFLAPSEGQTPQYGWLYSWVVGPNGQPWEVTGSYPYKVIYPFNIYPPVLYNKVAFSYLALFNSTFARNLAIDIEQKCPAPTQGYYDGADTTGNLVDSISTNTNSLILDAALYALEK